VPFILPDKFQNKCSVSQCNWSLVTAGSRLAKKAWEKGDWGCLRGLNGRFILLRSWASYIYIYIYPAVTRAPRKLCLETWLQPPSEHTGSPILGYVIIHPRCLHTFHRTHYHSARSHIPVSFRELLKAFRLHITAWNIDKKWRGWFNLHSHFSNLSPVSYRCDYKRRFELEQHGRKSQKASIKTNRIIDANLATLHPPEVLHCL
jgi:hypothetical protein